MRESVEERAQESARVVRVAREHQADVVERLKALGAGGDEIGALIEAHVGLLEQASERLLSAYAMSDAGGSKAARDLERVLWDAQGRIAEPYGPELLQLYGLEESPPAGARALATYAHNAVALLRAQPQVLEGRFGDHLETDRIAERVEAPLRALDDYLATLDEAAADQRGAYLERERASDDWVRVWRGTSTVLSGLFYLAGRADLAARVRPVLPGLRVERGLGELGEINAEEIERASSL